MTLAAAAIPGGELVRMWPRAGPSQLALILTNKLAKDIGRDYAKGTLTGVEPAKKGRKTMRHRAQRMIPILMSLGLLFPGALVARAADPEIDRLLQSPIGKDWVTNGGNMTNQRFSTLKQIDTTNVKQLKGAWMTRLKGSGLGGKGRVSG